MTRLSAIEKEIVGAHTQLLWELLPDSLPIADAKEIQDFLIAALSRVAEETFREVMPEESTLDEKIYPFEKFKDTHSESDGWNGARDKMQQNFIKFTEKV